LWLVFPKSGDRLLTQEAVNRLQRLARETPPRLVADREYWLIPLFPRIGAERDVVLEDLKKQVAAIGSLIFAPLQDREGVDAIAP
jgi:hypothetical protein